ncbi:MAG: hypothetical protein O2913_10575 [Chloroflexi bacterium]|nr:hypothetical protein [Chloroflexota bacterium]
MALSRGVDTIWHFEPLTPFAIRLVGAFRRLGLIRAEIKLVNHHIGEVPNRSPDRTHPDTHDDTGEWEYINIIGQARAICSRIKLDHLNKNPLINSMSSIWPAQKLSFHFERMAEREIIKELVRVSLVDWLNRNHPHSPAEPSTILLENKQWYSYVEPSASACGIRVISYRNYWKPPQLSRAASAGIASFRRLLELSLKRLRSKPTTGLDHHPEHSQAGSPSDQTLSDGPTVAVSYWHRTLEIDPTKRSEFFWLNDSKIPQTNILLHEYSSDKPLSEETKADITYRGIRVLGRGPGIDSWRPTIGMYRVFLTTLLKLANGLLRNFFRLKWVSLYYIKESIGLASRYAYWHDFYRSNGVKIDVAVVRYDLAKVLALGSVGGISLSYQYTVGSFCPTTLISCGEDVQFVYSPYFEKQFRDVEAVVDRFVPTGFIYDGALRELRSSTGTGEIREQFSDRGVKFTLCFFDENSVPFWDHPCHDEDAAADYEFLLEWLLSDPTLGIVFKPKNSMTLFDRISTVSDLVKRAEETGRCRFLTSETLYGSIYPAEAALLADVAVGKLLGGSAAFEGQLAGVPSLLINTERRGHPFCSWGQDRVVFDDWVSLREAIERYRNNPSANPEFGDWSPAIDDLDPFRDGQAGRRMGRYVGQIYESLKRGDSKAEAMAAAAGWYSTYLNEGKGLSQEGNPPSVEERSASSIMP